MHRIVVLEANQKMCNNEFKLEQILYKIIPHVYKNMIYEAANLNSITEFCLLYL